MEFVDYNLPDVKTVILTVPKYVERQRTLLNFFADHNYKEVSFSYGEISNPYWTTHYMNFLRVLKENRKNAPLIVLEDDVAPFKYNDKLTAPCDALVYLGGTLFTEPLPKDKLTPEVEVVGDWNLAYIDIHENWLKPLNMQSFHAVFYPTTEIIDETLSYVYTDDPKVPIDVVTANAMHNGLNVALIGKPYWYQNDGRNNWPTVNYFSYRKPR